MRWAIKQEDLDKFKAQHGAPDSVVGYADEHKLLAIPMPKMYVVLIDETDVLLVQLTMNMEEKALMKIPIKSIQSVKISGVTVKKVGITTDSGKVSLAVKPLAVGIQPAQKQLLNKLKELGTA